MVGVRERRWWVCWARRGGARRCNGCAGEGGECCGWEVVSARRGGECVREDGAYARRGGECAERW
jgi:hypothetical protein